MRSPSREVLEVEDALGQVFGGVGLWGGIWRRFGGGGNSRHGQPVAAFEAKFRARRKVRSATGANQREARAAFEAEFRVRGVFMPAQRTLHGRASGKERMKISGVADSFKKIRNNF